MVDLRKQLSKANVPNDGKRYLLATPDTYAALLKCPQFTDASNLAENVKETGAVGKIAGFTVLEWNDSTAGLAFIAGHPKFATRVNDWKVPVALYYRCTAPVLPWSKLGTFYVDEAVTKEGVTAVTAYDMMGKARIW